MSYGAEPVQWTHSLIIGDTYSPADVTLLQADGTTPYDLTGASGVCQIRSSSGTLLLSPTVTIVDAAGGVFAWTDTAAHTAAISAQQATYAVRLTFGDGTVKTVIEGVVNIRASGVST